MRSMTLVSIIASALTFATFSLLNWPSPEMSGAIAAVGERESHDRIGGIEYMLEMEEKKGIDQVSESIGPLGGYPWCKR